MGGEHTDWCLASIGELRLMGNALFTLERILLNDGNPLSVPIDFTTINHTFYWSSTEQDAAGAWCYFFFDTDTTAGSKLSNSYKVRAVRAF